LAFGVPTIEDPAGTAFGLILSTLAFVSFGVAVGMLLPSARAGQGIGLMLFFPMFLLGGGGPPIESLDGAMRTVADWLPLTHAIRAVQEPWLGLGDEGNHLLVMAALLVTSAAVWVWRSATVSRTD
jgi:ABC-2 type transport system permease protein